MKRFSRAVAFLALLIPLSADAAKPTLKKNVRVSSQPPGKLEPTDLLIVDGLDYPVPRNINRKPGILPTRSAKNLVGPPAPPPEIYTAVDPTQ